MKERKKKEKRKEERTGHFLKIGSLMKRTGVYSGRPLIQSVALHKTFREWAAVSPCIGGKS